MKRSMHSLTLTGLIAGAAIIVAMIVSPADGNKSYSIEAGDIAFVDVFDLIDKALLVEDKAKAREEFNSKSTLEIEGLNQQLQGLETQLSSMTQNDPNAMATYQEHQSVSAKLDSRSRQINVEYQTLIAVQISDGYAEIYAAANEVGTEEGFAFVFASRSNGELVQTETITGITQEILARPLMTPPSGVDLTELVRVKLGYPEAAPEPVVTETEPEAETPAVETPIVEDDS